MTKHCVVVGGGITGCIAALELRRRGEDVCLYESDDTLGGVLKDSFVHGQPYFSNCQYVSANVPWLSLLSNAAKQQFYEFDHRYASLTSNGTIQQLNRDIAIPVFKSSEIPKLGTATLTEFSTLQDRLEHYPPDIASMLMEWAKKFGVAPNNISANNANAIQIARIYLEGNDSVTQELKLHHETWDALLGLPRAKRVMMPLYERCLLPKAGYNSMFSKMHDDLADKGINVQLKAPISVKNLNQNKPPLFLRGKTIPYEKLIWACNPVPLLIAMGIGRLENPFARANVFFMECQNNLNVHAPFYVQVFSSDIPIFRIFIYVAAGQCLATVEGFESLKDQSQAAKHVNNILNRFDIKSNFTSVESATQKRHIFYTPKDLEKFLNFDQHPNVVSGEIINAGWAEYGRDQKIAKIFNAISSS